MKKHCLNLSALLSLTFCISPAAQAAPDLSGIPELDVEVYNDFWFDAGETLDTELRTSLIIDPPNGRLPATLAGEGELRYEATVTAPNTFVEPFTVRVSMQSTKDKIYEYACHEANYAMAGILRGARQREADAPKRAASYNFD